MPGGRPTKLTDELERIICDNLSAGMHKEIAAGVAGVHYGTFSRWMLEGKKDPDSREGQFRAAVEQALKRSEATLVASIFKGSLADPRVGLEFLGRRHPNRWAKNAVQKHEVKHRFDDDGAKALADAFGRLIGGTEETPTPPVADPKAED
jgi:hypothetical protein